MILGHHHQHLYHHGGAINGRIPKPFARSVGMLDLKPIQPAKIKDGAYKIVFSGALPSNSNVRLLLGNSERFFVDITGGYKTGHGKHQSTHLEELLDVMHRGHFWGKSIPVRVAAYSGGRMCVETLSPVRFMQCPLEPLQEVGIEEIGAVPGLWYTGKHEASGETKTKSEGSGTDQEEKTGTILSHPINGRYHFIYAGKFEVDADRRGFDCTTYAGAAAGLLDGKGQGGTGETVAQTLNAESCKVEGQHAKVIDKFFQEHANGTFIMWSHGHVVFVKDGIVHEFTDRVSRDRGYQATEIAKWLTLAKHPKQKFSVRKVSL